MKHGRADFEDLQISPTPPIFDLVKRLAGEIQVGSDRQSLRHIS